MNGNPMLVKKFSEESSSSVRETGSSSTPLASEDDDVTIYMPSPRLSRQRLRYKYDS